MVTTMGKTGKWFRSFLGSNKKVKEKEEEKEKGRKEKDEEREKNGVQPFSNSSSVNENQSNPRSNPPKEKRRWSFRRSAATRDSNSQDPIAANPTQACRESESEQKQHSVAVDTAAPTDAAATVAQATAAMVRIANVAHSISLAAKEAAAIKIQSVFRSHLARKALCALRGLVKLQALVRGHLVRKQATATLRCMQALVTVQARARAQRLRIAEDPQLAAVQRQSTHRKSSQENQLRLLYEMERSMEDNVKIVEMDLGESRGGLKSRTSYSNPQSERSDPRFSSYYPVHRGQSKQDQYHISPGPSALTDQSPRASSGHFEEYSFTTTQSSPQHFVAISRPDPTRTPFSLRSEYAESLPQDYPFFPSYMANTESSRAKARSQSAPRQRPESCEKVATTKRRVSIEGRNVPRSLRMQRSSSHVGSTGNGYQQYGWPIKLDRSTISLKDSEHGSTCSVLTNANYCRSLIAIEGQGNRY